MANIDLTGLEYFDPITEKVISNRRALEAKVRALPPEEREPYLRGLAKKFEQRLEKHKAELKVQGIKAAS